MIIQGNETNEQIIKAVKQNPGEVDKEFHRLHDLAGATEEAKRPSWLMDSIAVLQSALEIYRSHDRGSGLNLNTPLKRELNDLFLKGA